MTKNQKIKDNSLLTPPTDAPSAAVEQAPVVDKTVDNLKNLKAMLAGLSQEEREQMARLGVAVPSGDIEAAVRGEYTFGLRCTQCNEMALYFVGDKFLDVATGVEYDAPQAWMTVQQLTWTQHLPSEEINRNSPQCQNCGHAVELQGNGSFRFDRRLTRLDSWKASRDAAYSRRALQELRRKVNSLGDAVQMPDGRVVQLSDQVRRDVVSELASQVIARTNPQALKDIAQVEQLLGGDLLGALAREQSGR